MCNDYETPESTQRLLRMWAWRPRAIRCKAGAWRCPALVAGKCEGALVATPKRCAQFLRAYLERRDEAA